MTTHDLAPFVTTFFTRHLPAERNASPHTIAAYRDTLKLLLRFLAASLHRTASALHVEDLTPERTLAFLEDLETTRRNTIRTRNARLAAIHSFFRYVLDTEPALALLCQRVLAIPVKKAPRPVLGYLSDTELAHVLAQIDRSTPVGERDYLLVALLYDTGARIQELLDLAPCDVRFAPPPFVRLFGKGRRERLTPLLPQTARLVRRFLAAAGRREEDTAPLIQNRNGQRLTRHGARYLLDKYVQRAQVSLPSLARTRISPHTFRHTKAMHLLQSDRTGDRCAGGAGRPRRRSAQGGLRLDSAPNPWHNSKDWLGLSELETVTRAPDGTPGPHPAPESAAYATRTRCPSPAPRLWTLPLPWTPRARPPELAKPRRRSFAQPPQPSSLLLVLQLTNSTVGPERPTGVETRSVLRDC